MLTKIVDFELEHIDIMDMRDHEKSIDIDFTQLKELSVVSKTVFVDGEVMCCWGVLENDGLWQIPSKKIQANSIFYARLALKVIKYLIKDLPNAHSYCLDDELHARWMKFIGLHPNKEKVYDVFGHKYILYEVK